MFYSDIPAIRFLNHSYSYQQNLYFWEKVVYLIFLLVCMSMCVWECKTERQSFLKMKRRKRSERWKRSNTLEKSNNRTVLFAQMNEIELKFILFIYKYIHLIDETNKKSFKLHSFQRLLKVQQCASTRKPCSKNSQKRRLMTRRNSTLRNSQSPSALPSIPCRCWAALLPNEVDVDYLRIWRRLRREFAFPTRLQIHKFLCRERFLLSFEFPLEQTETCKAQSIDASLPDSFDLMLQKNTQTQAEATWTDSSKRLTILTLWRMNDSKAVSESRTTRRFACFRFVERSVWWCLGGSATPEQRLWKAEKQALNQLKKVCLEVSPITRKKRATIFCLKTRLFLFSNKCQYLYRVLFSNLWLLKISKKIFVNSI